MKYLLTGGSGFLGGILKDSLRQNHDVVTLGRSITNGIIADLSMEEPILPPVDVIIHVAGKAHIVPKTENEKERKLIIKDYKRLKETYTLSFVSDKLNHMITEALNRF